MAIGEYIKAMRDVAGLPSPPIVFDFFLVLTFTFHILLVNLVVGSLALVIWGRIKKEEYWIKLSSSLSRLVVNSISWAIVLGIAPLLFIQVIYDPLWYTANTLSAVWALAFLVFIALAFVFAYCFYLGGGYEGRGQIIWPFLSLALLLLAGIVIHSLTVTQLHPEKWPSFAIQNNTYISSGKYLHEFEIFRFLHFIFPAFAVTGIWLIFYSKYFKEKYDSAYLNWVEKLGAKLILVSSLLQAAVGILWLITLPKELNFISNPYFILALIVALLFIAFLFYMQKNPSQYAVPTALFLGITVFVMSIAREVLRMSYFGLVGYTFADYPVNYSVGSLVLFLLTFLMGLIVLYYVAIVAYRAGKGIKEVGAHQLGKVSVTLMWLWIIIMVILGIYISLKNGTLF
ncbi:MAG: hypothetical protein ACP5HI_07990 [Caldimicrobium sp.]